MNIVSALLRVVGKRRAARMDEGWWWSISYANGYRRIYRHRDSRFVYPPSLRHVRFGAKDRQSEEQGERAPGSGRSVHVTLQLR